MKNKATLITKLASVLLAVAVLLTVFSVAAEGTNGYYKTIASQDYEKANPLTSKVENVSVTTLSNGSTGYLYANPAAIKNITIVPISGMKQGEKYTYMVDLYVIDYSNDAGGCITRLDLANMDGQLVEAYLGKSNYNLNQWYTYSKEVTYNTTKDSWISIHTFGEARVIYDNARIVDANGNVIFIEDFETETRTLTDGFSYIHDYSNGSVNADDKVLKLSNSSSGVVTGTIGEFPLGAAGTTTNYTLTYDYLIINKGSNSSDPDFAFKYSSYCATCHGDASFNHKPIGDKEHYIGSNKEVNKWYSDTMNFHFDEKCDNTYAEIYLFPGAVVIFDNIVVKDENGNVIKEYKMDSGSVTGGIGRGSFGNGTIEFAPKNELIWLKGVPNLIDGHFYSDTRNLTAEYKAVDIKFNSSVAIPAGKYPVLYFDYKLNGTPKPSNGVAVGVSFNGITGPSYSRNFIKLTDTNGEWAAAPATTFTNLDIKQGENVLNLLVYGGFELEIDNIRMVLSDADAFVINFADNGTFTEESAKPVITGDNYEFKYILDKEDTVTADDKVLKLSNPNESGNVNGTIGEFALGAAGTTTNYTLTYDYVIINKSTSASNAFAFKYSSYCATCHGDASFNHKPIGDKEHYIGSDKEVNKWYSDTMNFHFDEKCDNTYAEIHLYPGAVVIFDNIVVKDEDGNVVKEFNMNSGTVTGGIGRGSFGTGTIEFIAKSQLTGCVGTPNLVDDGHFYSDTTNLTAEYKAIDIKFNSSVAIPAGKYPVLNFDYKLNGTPKPSNGVAIGVSFNGITEPAYSRNFIKLTDTNGEWVAAPATTFTNLDIKQGENVLTLLVYGGFELEIDNIRMVLSDADAFIINFADNGSFTDQSEKPSTSDAYDIKYIVDGEGLKTYGSNGVLKIAPSENMYYGINKANFGVDFVAGNKYRLSMDYMVTVPSPQNFYFAVTNINGNGNHDFINYEDELSGSLSYEFVYTGSVDLVIYGGGEIILDNVVIEEFVSYPTLGIQKRGDQQDATVSALAYGMQLKTENGAEYIYDINGNAIEVAEKGFIAVLSNRIDGELTLANADTNPYVSVIKVTAPAQTVVFAGDDHNVYTLAITDPELERNITVRPYVKDAEGNAYYGDTVDACANDLADYAFNTWIGAAVNQ